MNARYGKSLWTLADDHWQWTECLYAAAITVTTVGYTDLLGTERVELWEDQAGLHRWVSATDPHEDPGFDGASARLAVDWSPWTRGLSVLQVVLGMAFFLYVIAQVTDFVVDRGILTLAATWRARRRARRMHEHVVLCGAGDVGVHALDRFLEAGVPCVVLESDPGRDRELWDSRPNVACLAADATEEEALQAAGLGRARGLVATAGDDRTNLVSVVTARLLRADLRIVARGEEDDAPRRLRAAGAAAVVSRPALAGLRMASELARPGTVDFLDLLLAPRGESPLALEGVEVGVELEGRAVAAERVCDAAGVGLVALRRRSEEGFHYNPGADARIAPGDELAVIGEPHSLDRLRALLRDTLGTGALPGSETHAGAAPPGSALEAIPPGHFVVVGAGNTGRHVTRELHASGRSVGVVECDLERAARLGRELAGIEIVEGDARDPETLLRVGLERARGLATTLPSDRDNLVVLVTARDLRPGLGVVSLTSEDGFEPRLTRLDARVVSAGRIAGRRLAAEVLQPSVTTFLDRMLGSAGAVRFEAVRVVAGSSVDGARLSDAALHARTGLRVLALRHAGESAFRSGRLGDEVLGPGTLLVVAGAAGPVGRLAALVGDWD